MPGNSRPRTRREVHGDSRLRSRIRAIMLVAAAVLGPALSVGSQAGPATAEPPQRDHSVRTSPAEGRFRCGDLLLTVTDGTETETVDSSFKNGVADVWIERRYDGVVLSGSDGYSYRAIAHVSSHFVLVEPDFDNPVRGDEIIHVSFLGGPQGSPGHLDEHLRIRDGVESDEVTGSCDYAD